MSEAETIEGISLTVSDVSGQKVVRVKPPGDASVGELVHSLLSQMRLPANDSSGRALVYQARRQRDGQALHAAERIGDVLTAGDKVKLQPNIDAG